MTHRNEVWDAMKAHKKNKFNTDRALFHEKAIAEDDGGWMKHTEYHWSRTVGGHRLDYWPSRKKYQYKGKVMRGDVMRFIAKHAEIAG